MKITVLVQAQAKQNSVITLSFTHFKVKTTAPARENKANVAVIKLLSQHLHLKKSQIHLISGTTSKTKIFQISES